MSEYLLVYYGRMIGTTHDAGVAQMTWGAWFSSLGKSLVTLRATGSGKMVTSAGTRTITEEQMATGYAVIRAGSLEAAVRLAEKAPGVSQGMKIAVFPLAEMTAAPAG